MLNIAETQQHHLHRSAFFNAKSQLLSSPSYWQTPGSSGCDYWSSRNFALHSMGAMRHHDDKNEFTRVGSDERVNGFQSGEGTTMRLFSSISDIFSRITVVSPRM